jgi:hypothetical protein
MSVSGFNRVPNPAANTAAFIGASALGFQFPVFGFR